jgi:hypothetical protein
MFRLTKEEAKNLRLQFATSSLKSQFVISGSGYGGRRYLPYVFTEQGVAMLSTVLKQQTRNRSEHCHHADVRAAPSDPRSD